MKKKFMVIALAAAITAIFAASAFALSNGAQVKNFTLKDTEGHSVSLEQFRGKVVVLNFWATWCPPCRNEMPEFNEMNKEFKKSGRAVLLAINMTDGQRDTPEKAAKFMKDNKYTMTTLLDTEQTLADYFSIRYIPSTYVINAQGKLVGQIQGGTTKAAVMKLVDEAK
ncbi:MAG: TlpA disulfide reductase family protein [Cloacibacillus sp.]